MTALKVPEKKTLLNHSSQLLVESIGFILDHKQGIDFNYLCTHISKLSVSDQAKVFERLDQIAEHSKDVGTVVKNVMRLALLESDYYSPELKRRFASRKQEVEAALVAKLQLKPFKVSCTVVLLCQSIFVLIGQWALADALACYGFKPLVGLLPSLAEPQGVVWQRFYVCATAVFAMSAFMFMHSTIRALSHAYKLTAFLDNLKQKVQHFGGK